MAARDFTVARHWNVAYNAVTKWSCTHADQAEDRRAERREPSVRGRVPRAASRAPRLPHHRDATVADANRAVALPQQHQRHVLRPGGPPAAVSARTERGSAARRRRKLRGKGGP